VVSGQAKVGDNSFLGVNATIVNEIKVGEGCFIGAGALVTKNTKENTVHITRSSEMLRYSASEYSKFFM
jgi:carbonic anhydrase/acetyltransferase-like protein (isoleucine patch superfamily)